MVDKIPHHTSTHRVQTATERWTHNEWERYSGNALHRISLPSFRFLRNVSKCICPRTCNCLFTPNEVYDFSRRREVSRERVGALPAANPRLSNTLTLPLDAESRVRSCGPLGSGINDTSIVSILGKKNPSFGNNFHT